MHPNAFLKTFWRAELRPQIFVAMSFADAFKGRFDRVIEPAIRGIAVGGVPLVPYRVDLSKSGDSILTDIVDGIAHSQMILADVSVIGYDPEMKAHFRNGNVMYEVGIALACRQPSEVLLIRDDEHRFLFDVSTIPHMRLDFRQVDQARSDLHEALLARLKERKLVDDARVQIALASLSSEEVTALKGYAEYPPDTVWGRPNKGTVDFFGMASIPRLLDKQLIKVVGEFEEGHPAYSWTPIGAEVGKLIKAGLPKFKADSPPESTDKKEAASDPSA